MHLMHHQHIFPDSAPIVTARQMGGKIPLSTIPGIATAAHAIHSPHLRITLVANALNAIISMGGLMLCSTTAVRKIAHPAISMMHRKITTAASVHHATAHQRDGRTRPLTIADTRIADPAMLQMHRLIILQQRVRNATTQMGGQVQRSTIQV